ncbi:MAG TPA: hypothetical protein VFE33_28115 [Thermoanaerobaculia bacterium]|nr:hypothetical protein [Thermoanaerobaculia bacterium]
MVHSRFRFWSSWSLVLVALPLSGCMASELLNDNRLTWLWGVLPFAGFTFAAWVLAHWRRLLGLEAWRLDRSPSLPAAGRFYRIGLGVWLVTVVLFALGNALVPDHDSRQVVWNVLGWFTGALLGVGLGIYIGIRQAEKRYAVQIHPEVAR